MFSRVLMRLISFTACIVHVLFHRNEISLSSKQPNVRLSAMESLADPFHIHPTEIFEYARLLVDPYFYIAQFQIWKLLYAVKLRDCGFADKVSLSCMRLLLKIVCWSIF